MAKNGKPEFVFSPEQVEDLIPHLLDMEQWCKQFRDFLALLVDSGHEVPGVSLEATAPQRKWDGEVPPEKLAKTLLPLLKKHGVIKSLDEIAPRSVASPAQVEKLVGEAAYRASFANLVRMHSTGNMSLRIQWPPKQPETRDKATKAKAR